MPEDERYTSNEDDYFEWDPDNGAPGESEVADLLDEEGDE